VAHAGVLYTSAGPHLVSDNHAFPLPGLSLSRGTTATGTLCFKYTVTHPASNKDTETYFAGMSELRGPSGAGVSFSTDSLQIAIQLK
jgi:hypothetical protein